MRNRNKRYLALFLLLALIVFCEAALAEDALSLSIRRDMNAAADATGVFEPGETLYFLVSPGAADSAFRVELSGLVLDTKSVDAKDAEIIFGTDGFAVLFEAGAVQSISFLAEVETGVTQAHCRVENGDVSLAKQTLAVNWEPPPDIPEETPAPIEPEATPAVAKVQGSPLGVVYALIILCVAGFAGFMVYRLRRSIRLFPVRQPSEMENDALQADDTPKADAVQSQDAPGEETIAEEPAQSDSGFSS